MHARTTAREIVDDFKGERLDYWVTGYGTGGTLNGVSRVLAKEMPDTKIVVCEPMDAPLLESGKPQARNPDGTPAATHPAWFPHPMQGWTPDFIPKLTGDVDMKRIHKILPIAGADAMRARISRPRKASSSASRRAQPSPGRCRSPRERRRERTSCACCPTRASAI
jgi:cysteine synthase A